MGDQPRCRASYRSRRYRAYWRDAEQTTDNVDTADTADMKDTADIVDTADMEDTANTLIQDLER